MAHLPKAITLSLVLWCPVEIKVGNFSSISDFLLFFCRFCFKGVMGVDTWSDRWFVISFLAQNNAASLSNVYSRQIDLYPSF